MNTKLNKAMKKSKKALIIGIVLWLFFAIALTSTLAYSLFAATYEGGFDFETFFDVLFHFIMKPFSAFKGLMKFNAIGMYFKTLIGFTFVFAICFAIGVYRARPKNEYEDIEHGSSDWSENGEQYEVLSKNKGIILAENNYLPVDKRGNVNVLVVGRIRFW